MVPLMFMGMFMHVKFWLPVLYVRIAVYGRITAVPYRIKPLKPQNTVRNVRSVTVYGPPTIRPLPYTVRCGALVGRSLLSEVRSRRKRFRVFPPAVIPTSKCQTLTGVCCPSRHASSHQCSFATRGARAPTGTNSNGRRNWGESFFSH